MYVSGRLFHTFGEEDLRGWGIVTVHIGYGKTNDPSFWCNATCVHESFLMKEDCERTFVRLSMPNDAPWYNGYTKNPKGIKPTGVIIPAAGWGRIGENEVILKG